MGIIAPSTKIPVIAHSRHSAATATLRCLNILDKALLTEAIRGSLGAFAAATGFTGSRMVNHMSTATISPGMPTIQKTVRQVVNSSSWVAMIGPKPLPNSEMLH